MPSHIFPNGFSSLVKDSASCPPSLFFYLLQDRLDPFGTWKEAAMPCSELSRQPGVPKWLDQIHLNVVDDFTWAPSSNSLRQSSECRIHFDGLDHSLDQLQGCRNLTAHLEIYKPSRPPTFVCKFHLPSSFSKAKADLLIQHSPILLCGQSSCVINLSHTSRQYQASDSASPSTLSAPLFGGP